MRTTSVGAAYEHVPSRGELLWLDGAWSCPGARPRQTVFHPACEVGIILNGAESILYEGGHEVMLRRGDVWLCNAWEVHGWEVPEEGVRTVVPHFLPEFLGDADIGIGPWQVLFAAPPELRPRVRDGQVRDHMCAIGEDLSRESSLKRPSWAHLVRLEILHILTELAREWEPGDLAEGEAAQDERVQVPKLPDRLMPALVLVRSAHPHRVSVSQAAAACAMSASRFQAEFAQAAGRPFGRFCLEMRLQAARHLLASSQLTVKEVARQTGFWDDCHLHRAFLREYQLTPAHYRASRQQAPVGGT